MPNRLGLPALNSQAMLVEHNAKSASWIIWLHYNVNINAGTYLELRSDGSVHRVVQEPNGEIVISDRMM